MIQELSFKEFPQYADVFHITGKAIYYLCLPCVGTLCAHANNPCKNRITVRHVSSRPHYRCWHRGRETCSYALRLYSLLMVQLLNSQHCRCNMQRELNIYNNSSRMRVSRFWELVWYRWLIFISNLTDYI